MQEKKEQQKKILEEELQEIIIKTVKKIKTKEVLVKINTTVQFWYNWQEKEGE